MHAGTFMNFAEFTPRHVPTKTYALFLWTIIDPVFCQIPQLATAYPPAYFALTPTAALPVGRTAPQFLGPALPEE